MITLAELFSYGMRRTLDYLGMYLQRSNARTVRIQSEEPAVIQQVMLRLPLSLKSVDIPANVLGSTEHWPWLITSGNQTNAVLYPFSLETGSPIITADHAIGCFRNTWSYKKLLYPATPTMTMATMQCCLAAANYHLCTESSIYSPAFMFLWLLTMLAARYALPIHFRLKDYALRHLTTTGFDRHFSYIRVFHAQR